MDRRLSESCFHWIAILLLLASTAICGPLDPPAAPAPTFKTLDEAAPGTPIRHSDLPLTINQSGSYYLVESVQWIGTGPAISIVTPHVTLDLRGFTIDGLNRNADPARSGILASGQRAVIRNGAITNMGGGAITSTGSAVIEDIRVTTCGSWGITATEGIVRRCTVFAVMRVADTTTQVHGIRVGFDGIVEDCWITNVSASNGAGDIIGISASSGSAIRRSKVWAVTAAGNDKAYTVYGIKTNGSGIVEDCHIESINGGSTSPASYGIHTSVDTMIRGNQVQNVNSSVSATGIYVFQNATVSNNDIKIIGRSMTGGTATGIHLGERSHALSNTINMPRNATGESTMVGILMKDRAEAHDNSISIDAREGPLHGGYGVVAEGDFTRIVGNRFLVETAPLAIRRSVLFTSPTSNGFAGANICAGPIVDGGSNILGTGNFANQVY